MDVEMIEIRNGCLLGRRKRKKTTSNQHKVPIALNLTVVGDKRVGKSSFIFSYIYNKFPNFKDLQHRVTSRRDDGYNTENTDEYHHHVALKLDNQLYKLNITDTKASKYFDTARFRAYSQTDCIILCYSVSNDASYLNIRKKWLPELHAKCPEVPIIVVATKTDLGEQGESVHEGEIVKANCSNIKGFVRCSAYRKQGLEYVILEAIQATKPQNTQNSCACV